MQALTQFLKFLFSRQMLAFVTVVALACAIWFVGPLLSFDGARPLASAAARVTVIVMLLVLLSLWLVAWPLSLVGIPALCLAIWHLGPLLAVGQVAPLASTQVRVVIVAIILLAYLLYGVYRLWQAMRTDTEFLRKVLDFGSGARREAVAAEELKTVSEIVARALRQLRTLRLRRGFLRRIFEGRRYLYELPWYMIVGSAGAGKTTVLLNSGLQFPVSRQMGNASRVSVLESGAGTLNCQWWFANEAVLIDTAGRYTTQDSDKGKDTEEWAGFLALLRKHRPRAPINGAIVALSVAELRTFTPDQRVDHAALIRDRLLELRRTLGIRFPVYVLVTKADLLQGFEEYFLSLTSEGRAQPWGFTFPVGADKVDAARVSGGNRQSAMRLALDEQLDRLHERLSAGLRGRLIEEFDTGHRRRLFALPQEFDALREPLVQVLEEVFLDSRFDDTQSHAMLRGVYFTSGAQARTPLPPPADTVFGRLRRALAGAGRRTSIDAGMEAATGHRGFFLHDVFARIIIPEAHLVRPNLRWELRFRLLQLLGHALVLIVLAWLGTSMALSFRNNGQYLSTMAQRVQALAAQGLSAGRTVDPAQVPAVLDAAHALPAYAGLDLDHPPLSFQFGLYSAPPIVAAARQLYAGLQDDLLLPVVIARMEDELSRSVRERDTRSAYATLRAYKLLHDPERYMQGGARDVREWVMKDWERRDSDALFGGRAAMVGHVDRLFSGDRLVQSGAVPKEVLIRDVQAFLDGNTSTQRVYERAKSAMTTEAPQEFSLIRAVGPQVGTVFSRADGQPLDRGVPGLFTYVGYHTVFNKRLGAFVDRALQEDAWVMGRTDAAATAKAMGTEAERIRQNAVLIEDVRRQYLSEYAERWTAFLDSIRVVGAGEGGTSLGFDLAVLRQLSSPDSPLARLARAAARETTLSRVLDAERQQDKSLLDRATEQLDLKTRELGRNLGIRPEERMEREGVDDRFAALREVVTGQADVSAGVAPAGAGRQGLDSVLGLINEFYTVLVVADTAITAGSLPPTSNDVGARMRLEAGKLPAPFREVLSALAQSGADKVNQGATEILRKQAQQQFDRIMGLMAMQVTEPCRRGIEGRYPFLASGQDASIEDVTAVFAAGGAADAFFTKYLAAFVDTGVRPWRYKPPSTGNALVGAENVVNGVAPAPASTGPTLVGELLKLLEQGGPRLDTFYRAQQIRDLYFREGDGRRLAWKVDVRVAELEPSITALMLDIDGQGQRYVHGPVEALPVKWPGPRGGASAEITAQPRISAAGSTLMAQGPWALLRLMQKGRVVNTATPGRVAVEFVLDGRKAVLDLGTGSQPNPLNSDLFSGFHCPGAMG